MFLNCGQTPRFPFTNRWEKYIEECIISKKSITKNQWLTISFHKKNNWISKNIKEGKKYLKVWFSSDFAVMSKATWQGFKKKSWDRIKKIKSQRNTIYQNIRDSSKEKFDLKTELSNVKWELDILRNSGSNSSNGF